MCLETLLCLFIFVTHTSFFFFFPAHYVCYRLVDTLIYTRTYQRIIFFQQALEGFINKPSLLWRFCLKKSNVKWLHILVLPFFCEDQEHRQEVLSAFLLLRLKCDPSGCSDQVLLNEDCVAAAIGDEITHPAQSDWLLIKKWSSI